MKKYLLIGALALLALPACEKNDSDEPVKFVTVGLTDKIEISDVGMLYSSYDITDVSVVARFHTKGDIESDPDVYNLVILRGIPFDRESMTLALPADPPQEFMRNIALDFPEGFTISDTDAQTIAWVEIACNLTEDNRFYLFLHRCLDAGDGLHYYLNYIYCDRPVTVTGTAPDWWGHTTTYDLNLEKGWNMYVEKSQSNNTTGWTNTMTHQMPVGIMWTQNMWVGGR